MREIVQTLTATGVTAPAVLDTYISPFNVSIAVVISGTVSYSVQYTLDNPFSEEFDANTATWFNHPDLTAQTTSTVGNFAFPVRAVRLNSTITGAGSTTINIIQAGAF